MEKGDNIILTEPIITTGSYGSEFLPKGTKGTFIEEKDGMVEIKTKQDTFYVPLKSIVAEAEKAA